MIPEILIRELHPQAYRWSVTVCRGDRALASDVLQDVYVKIWERKAVFLSRSSLRTWLFALIRNTAADHFRRHGQDFETFDEEKMASSSFDETEVQQNNLFRLERLLQRLSPMQRSTLQLVFYHECTLEEASSILNITIGTTSTHYKRGKENLRKLLTKAD